MQKPTSNLEQIGAKVRSSLAAKHSAREKALQLTREVIFHCATAIRAVHRREYDNARELLKSAGSFLEQLHNVLADHSDLFYSGFVHNAEKEYAEAASTLALICRESLPDPDELGVSYPAYLNGLGEAVGELRRYLLDTLRQGGEEDFEWLFESMDDIYGLLVTIDFPDALTTGLRRTTDVIRGVLEKTRGDVTLFLKQRDLEQKLDRR